MWLLEKLGLNDSGRCRELEAKLEAANRTQAISEFDIHGRILDANENFLRILGYQIDDVVDRSHDIFVDDDTKNTQEYRDLWRKLSEGNSVVSEFKLIDKNKREVWVKASYTPLFDESGDPYKVIEYATDITETKLQSQLSSALKLCQANVMLADNGNNIVYMNNTVEQMLRDNEHELQNALPNFKVSDLVGVNIDTFHTDPSHQRRLLSDLTEPYSTDITVGDLIFGLIATPWYDSNKRRIGTLVEWDDKTARVLALRKEKEQAQENARIRKALDVCDTSVMMADADMNIVYMNDAVKKMFKNREAEIKRDLPGFDSSTLIGSNVDTFHKSPAHQRGLVASLSTPYKTRIEVAGLTFDLIATPLYDAGTTIGTVVEWADITDALEKSNKEQAQAAANARVKEALDKVTANVMIADADCNIIYLNKSVSAMMKEAQNDFKKILPNMDADKLIGANIDSFHKNPSHQRGLLKDLTSTYEGRVDVGERSFSIIANPVFQDGKRVGTVVEWADRTAERIIEVEVDKMIKAASAGNFSVNINTEGKTGFLLDLSNGLNNLVGTMEIAVNDIVRILGAIAKGDLTERITRDYQGAFGQLKQDANSTADKLTDVTSKIRMAATSISTSAAEVVQGNADLSQRTETQASSLEQTAASMEEMTSTVKQSAEYAVKANDMAEDAQKLASEGGEVVETAVVAMQEINKSSKKISDIIGVIDEIAFQTNLLALNAAVEAARAGDQGRGFAVVAGEVRNLAQRSAGAAKEIKGLISDSVTKVSDGTALVNRSGEVLTQIVESVNKVTGMMQEISTAAKEQSSGIDQVNKAVAQMDEMTQQNAALVEEAFAAGQAMSDQASMMGNVVGFFSKVKESTVDVTPEATDHEEYSSVEPLAAKDDEPYEPMAYENTTPKIDDDDEWEEF